MTYFVTMTDKFMSGWGGADGKIAKYVVECDTAAQAERIKFTAITRRPEMIYINLSAKKPRYYPLHKYQVTRKHWDDLGGVWKD